MIMGDARDGASLLFPLECEARTAFGLPPPSHGERDDESVTHMSAPAEGAPPQDVSPDQQRGASPPGVRSPGLSTLALTLGA